MTTDEMILKIPAYARGCLSAEDTVMISRALPGSPELMEELRFALAVRRILCAREASAPAIPSLPALSPAQVHEIPRTVPGAMARSAETAGRAFSITNSAVRLALGFL